MSNGVKVMVLPGGERIATDDDDARVRAEALRLGAIEPLTAAVRDGTGERGASMITRDGDRLVAIIVWAGFEKASNNGWASMSVTPASEKTAAWLMDAVNILIDADSMALLPGGPSCPN